jgi:hypothetical protein
MTVLSVFLLIHISHTQVISCKFLAQNPYSFVETFTGIDLKDGVRYLPSERNTFKKKLRYHTDTPTHFTASLLLSGVDKFSLKKQ